jgi:hypothetical protein
MKERMKMEISEHKTLQQAETLKSLKGRAV